MTSQPPKTRLQLAFSPPADVSQHDTGLKFTDILFGFVLAELFSRLQHWSDLDPYVRWQLVAGSTLVLGSWIGFRRSLNRSRYEIKFFNLPFVRFALDQAMVIIYFRIATLTPDDPTAHPVPAASDLAQTTLFAMTLVFGLYVVWDVLGIWVAKAPLITGSRPPRLAKPTDLGRKYPAIGKDNKPDYDSPAPWDYPGLAISVVALLVVGVLWRISDGGTISSGCATALMIAATVVLLGYRMAKEVRSSWRSAPTPPTATPGPSSG